MQPVQLLNKGFLQCDGDIARLTVDEYHELCVAAWPGGEDLSVSEAEQQFWNLMVTEPGTGDAQIVGLKAARLRLEARYYQERVRACQTQGGRGARAGRASRRFVARVLPEMPWELREAPPVVARPVPPPKPVTSTKPRAPKVAASPLIAAAIAAATAQSHQPPAPSPAHLQLPPPPPPPPPQLLQPQQNQNRTGKKRQAKPPA